MSINEMTNAALARRRDYPPADHPPLTATERAAAAGAEPMEENRASMGLKTLTTYIPTEILTLYVAFLAVLQPNDPQSSPSGMPWYLSSRWLLFWIFLLLTPVSIWVAFATKLVSDKKELPKRFQYWPKWEMIAGTIAYVAWVSGLPGTPFAQLSWFSTTVGGLLVLATSTVLAKAAGLFQQELAATKPVP